jgi:hypothetical protein
VGSNNLGPFANYFENSSAFLDGYFWTISGSISQKVVFLYLQSNTVFFSPIQCYLELFRERLRNARVPLPIGKMIPEQFQVLNIQTAKLEKLQDYLGEVTVLNFGSCTWPPFMKSIKEFERIVENFPSGKNLRIRASLRFTQNLLDFASQFLECVRFRNLKRLRIRREKSANFEKLFASLRTNEKYFRFKIFREKNFAFASLRNLISSDI